MRAAAERVVEDPRRARGVILGKHRLHGRGHRAEVNRDVLRLHDHLAGGIEQRGRGVAALLDVRRVRRADQRGAHLLARSAQRARDDLQLDRIDRAHPASACSRRRCIVPSSIELALPAGRYEERRLRQAPYRGTVDASALPRLARLRKAQRWRRVPHRGPHRDQLDLGVVVAIAVAAVVLLGETLTQHVGLDRLAVHRELKRLPAVAELVERPCAQRLASVVESGLRQQLIAHARNALGGQRPATEHHGSRHVASRSGGGQAQGAEHARCARAQDMGDAELARQRARVQRPRAAEGHQRQAARVDPALHGHHAQRAQHLGLGDPHDPRGAVADFQIELAREALDGAPGGGAIEHQPARQRLVLGKAIEQQVGVGDRRTIAASAVAGGARKRAR